MSLRAWFARLVSFGVAGEESPWFKGNLCVAQDDM